MSDPTESATPGPQPVPGLRGLEPYTGAPRRAPVDLHLDANEGPRPAAALLETLAQVAGEQLRDYPKPQPTEALLADFLGLPPEQVLLTAGGDDALDRCCRAYLGPGRDLLLAVPSFEMIPRYARLVGASVTEFPWPGGAFPTDAILEAADSRTALVPVVSPNNPTGAVATADDLERLSAALPEALIVLDFAYGEFATEDLTPVALALPNVVVVRTFSKAWSLAGLRVGYALGPAKIIHTLRAAGSPYPVSGPALALIANRLAEGPDALAPLMGEIRTERTALAGLITELGGDPAPSEANFLLARFDDAEWVADGMAGLGIGVRSFPGRSELDGQLRISLPGVPADYERLATALRTTLAPEAFLFDMDGVLVDVSRSYRQAIVETAASYDVALGPEDITAGKRLPGSNNDWVLTQRLLAERGVEADLDEVTARFETAYQGSDTAPGLRRFETLIPARVLLEELAARLPLGIVTGRPRGDAERFLNEADLAGLFRVVICLEDAPLKPDPAPLTLALERLGCTRAWYVGDTPDDVSAARAAGLLPLGVAAPGESHDAVNTKLIATGAARVLRRLEDLKELLS